METVLCSQAKVKQLAGLEDPIRIADPLALQCHFKGGVLGQLAHAFHVDKR